LFAFNGAVEVFVDLADRVAGELVFMMSQDEESSEESEDGASRGPGVKTTPGGMFERTRTLLSTRASSLGNGIR
jgi:hypothetical protein